MEGMLKDAIYFMISYLAVIAFGFFLANFFSNGFLWAFIKTKTSRGNRILTIMHSQPRNYAAYGWVEGQKFKWFDKETKRNNNNKIPKSVAIQKGMFHQTFGMWMCEIDEATNNIIMPDKTLMKGFDAILQEDLIKQALQKSNEDQSKLIIILLCIVGFLSLVGVILGIVVMQKMGVLQLDVSALRSLTNVTTIEAIKV